MRVRRVWIVCALFAATVPLVPAPAAALTAAGFWAWHAPHSTREALLRAADQKIKPWDEVEKSVPDCSSAADWSVPETWNTAKGCIENRQRDPFSEPGSKAAKKATEALRKRTQRDLSSREVIELRSEAARSAVSESVPLTAPLTLDEQAEADKLRALRRFENQERLDVQEDLRELRDLLRAQ